MSGGRWTERHTDEYVQAVATALDRGERPAGAPEYEWVGPASELGLLQRCKDCGALVALADVEAHGRFHGILNDHARALAVLVNSHLAAHVHDRYDVRERIGGDRADREG